jgi:hypothetical protein
MLRRVLLALALFALAPVVSAQTAVTAADLSRLESSAADIDRLLTDLRKTDPTLATQVEKSLAELREDITYLKVKLRRESAVTREEYAGVRDRLETLRAKASPKSTVSAAPQLPQSDGKVWTLPVGTEMDVRLQTPLNSGTAKIEQRFEATTILETMMGPDIVIPAGAIVRGFVSSVRVAGKIDRRGSLTLSFDELRIGERSFRLRASVTQALDGKISQDVTRVGTVAAVGGIIGGILGGGKGALLGVLVGGGGTIAATEGANVDLPAGVILRIRLDQPLQIAR